MSADRGYIYQLKPGSSTQGIYTRPAQAEVELWPNELRSLARQSWREPPERWGHNLVQGRLRRPIHSYPGAVRTLPRHNRRRHAQAHGPTCRV